MIKSRVFKNLLKIFAAILLGIAISFFVIQRDERFVEWVHTQVKEFFRKNYLSELEGSIVSLNLLSPTLTMEHLVARPLSSTDESWQWRARRGTLSFSWLNFFMTGKLAIHIILHEYEASSLVTQGQLAIAEHLQKLFEPPAVPVPAFLKELLIRKGTFNFNVPDFSARWAINLHCDMKKIGTNAKVNFYPTGGALVVGEKSFIEDFGGTLSVDVQPTPQKARIKVTSALRFCLPHLPQQKTCFLEGVWLYDQGRFSLYNHDHSLFVQPFECDSQKQLSCTIRAPVQFLAAVANDVNKIYKKTDQDLAHLAEMNGSCVAHIMANASKVYGDIVLQKLQYPLISLDHVKLDFTAQDKKLFGNIDIHYSPTMEFQGSWSWDLQHGGIFSLANATAITHPVLSYWYSKPNSCMVTAQIADTGDSTIHYDAMLSHRILGTNIKSSGDLHKAGSIIEVSGTAGEKNYFLKATTEPTLSLEKAYLKEGEVVLAQSVQNGENQITGCIDYHLIRSWLPDSVRSQLAGQGTIEFQGRRTPKGISGTLELVNGTIKVPQLYNFIRSLGASFEWVQDEKKLAITNAHCRMYRGNLQSSQATILLDNSYHLSFIHLPVQLDNCFISWQKDLFTHLSGSLLFMYQQQIPSLQGTLFADRAHLRGNLFSNDTQKSLLFSSVSPRAFPDLVLKLSVLTKSPLQVKTSFLDAQAQFDVMIQRTISAPEVSGSIELLHGELKFPYRPLHITSGSIIFMPQQLFDPLIEMTAKSAIKKHTVSLFVSGSLQNPRLRFEASPTLTEEQIISLLISGAPGSSLPMAMPTFLVQNLQQIIFGPAQSSTSLRGYFNSLLQPFSRVRLVPRFSDETGRGGLRGAIEIEVNDQLSGLIEKNFSLTEDVLLEVDYLLSDDINLRAIKDEHGDLGGEMEIRWRF